MRNRIIVAVGATALAVACGGGAGSSSTATTPSSIVEVALTIFNATEGRKATLRVPTQAGRVSINAAELLARAGVSGVVASEMTIRQASSTSLGILVQAAGSDASWTASVDAYDVYFPNAGNNAPYGCHAAPTLAFGRNVVVGELNESGSTGPIRVWTDAIANIHAAIASRGYGSLMFQATATSPHMTVGFGLNKGGVAWLLNGKNAYMLSEQDPFRIDYDRPGIKDSALAEVWETLFGSRPAGADDLCGKSSRETLGLANITGDTQWGLSPVGIDLTTRGFTRAP